MSDLNASPQMSEQTYTQEQSDEMVARSTAIADEMVVMLLTGQMHKAQEMGEEGMAIDQELYFAIKDGRAPVPSSQPDFMERMGPFFEMAGSE